VRDFVGWEPGYTIICVLCNGERGGEDPPGPWQRHYGSNRRRIPIYGPPHSEGDSILGYMEYIHI